MYIKESGVASGGPGRSHGSGTRYSHFVIKPEVILPHDKTPSGISFPGSPRCTFGATENVFTLHYLIYALLSRV